MRERFTDAVGSCIGAGLVAGAIGVFAAPAAAPTVLPAKLPPLVPPGITLIEVVRELPSSSDIVLFIRPSDAEGRTLLVADADQPGVSNCLAECAKEFLPVPASAGAKPVGDWSIVRRQDGKLQWAYQSRPLYTWTEEEEPGEVATNIGLIESENGKRDTTGGGGARPTGLFPPKGWSIARFTPGVSIASPYGIHVTLVSAAQAVVLTDFEGRTLYGFDGDAKTDPQTCDARGCEMRWLPVEAPAIAMNVGDFSVVTRTDGSKQWAYKRRPLYRYSDDLLPEDAHGIDVDKRWSPAALSEGFRPAGVTVKTLDGYGDVLALNGQTLYQSFAFEKYWGGRNLRASFKNAYRLGKKLGTQACLNDKCLETWRPFLAPKDAVANGFWEPLPRSDGSKQWAYKGYALYTYAGDHGPQDHYGQATYDFAKLEGTPAEMQHAEMLAKVTGVNGGAGVYWSLAKPQ
jgi:predicted lipoprotein with Yx(FWY)xxD motif